MGKRDLSLRRYNIGKYRYRELKYFCLQYPEWVSEAARGNNINAANRIMIEQAAQEADEFLMPYILKNAADNIPYERLGNVPCGRRQFYQARRKFFYLLSLKKGH